MADEDPADPRVQAALAECAALAGDAVLAEAAAGCFRELVQEPGAWRRVREFGAATRGLFAAPQRLPFRVTSKP